MICGFCFHHCNLKEGQTGLCRARMASGGKSVPVNYGMVTALALDPIEKKPLRRFHPGSRILSVGSFGCNLRCPFCQNYEISMNDELSMRGHYRKISPADLASEAVFLKRSGNIGLAFTYNEPGISFEYVRDCAAEIHRAGMVTVLVSNGTLEDIYFRELISMMDAANIDLKGFTETWYRTLGGDLETVKRNIRSAVELGCHTEVTTLIVPGKNDGTDDMRRECEFLSGISPEIPLHITRFFPRWHMTDIPATPPETIWHLTEIAGQYLKYVYPGNL